MPEEFLAVTTRSKLRSVRFFPAMVLATRRVRRQLARTEGIVRWASLTAGPKEFWTVTVWRSRYAMGEFMRSDAHGEIMWRSSRWLHSLWLMRWRPGPHELGSWDGVTMAPAERPEIRDEQADERADALDAPTSAEGRRYLAAAAPSLASAIDPSGAITYESSRSARRHRRRVGRAAGMVLRLQARPLSMPLAVAELVGLRRRLRAEPGILRTAVGVGRRCEVCLLAVWAERAQAAGAIESSQVRRVVARWRGASWADEWLPENEFGHWDGMRLRRVGSRGGRLAEG